MRRTFQRTFKIGVVRRLEAGEPVAEIARAYGIDPNVLRRWRHDYDKQRDGAFPGPGRQPGKKGIAELSRRLEQHLQEIERLRHRIQRTEALTRQKADGLELKQNGDCTFPADYNLSSVSAGSSHWQTRFRRGNRGVVDAELLHLV